jgi:hypothetical protein
MGVRGPITGKADTTGQNVGNWTVTFDPTILASNVSQFEVYKMIVSGPTNSTFDVYVEAKQWDTSVFGDQNSWDPTQPLIMRPGETLYFYYRIATTNTPAPVVTIWLRYDPMVAVKVA